MALLVSAGEMEEELILQQRAQKPSKERKEEGKYRVLVLQRN